MFGRGEPVDTQIRQLETDITKVLADQRAWEHQLDEYVTAEVRGLAVLDSARAGQQLARRHVDECVEAIRSLQDEIDALIPKPRPGD